MSPRSEQPPQQPGADRFWGQFSQSRAGRSTSGDDAGGKPGGPGPPAGEPGQDAHCLEWCPICRSADLFRATVSPELRQQAESIQHEAMGVLKAFLDAYAEKASGGPTGPAAGRQEEEPTPPPDPQVKDIPLD